LASENSVVIGFDEPIVRSLQAIPQQRDRFVVDRHEVFMNAGFAEPITATFAITHTDHPGENSRYRLMHNAKSVSNAD
jgi:hypothetical protein